MGWPWSLFTLFALIHMAMAAIDSLSPGGTTIHSLMTYTVTDDGAGDTISTGDDQLKFVPSGDACNSADATDAVTVYSDGGAKADVTIDTTGVWNMCYSFDTGASFTDTGYQVTVASFDGPVDQVAVVNLPVEYTFTGTDISVGDEVKYVPQLDDCTSADATDAVALADSGGDLVATITFDLPGVWKLCADIGATGTFSEADHLVSTVSCSACAYGNYVNDAGSCSACEPGYYCPDGEVRTVCPEGTISLGGTVISCTLCDAGTYSNDERDACLPCDPGYHCGSPLSGPLQCAGGTYSAEGQTSCASCPAGHSCSGLGNTAPPPACDDGDWASAGSESCTECDSGFYCPPEDKGNPPRKCAMGQYSVAGSTACRDCQRGYECPSTDTETACDSGEYSEGGSTACTACPDGYYCETPSSTPQHCPSGMYSDGSQTECLDCTQGYACPEGGVRYACTAPHYSPGGDVTSCLECPPGHECPTANAAVECDPTEYSVGSQLACSACPAGYECPDVNNVGEPCGLGYYAEAGDGTCTECPAGQACTDTTAAPTGADDCPAGKYSLSGASSCTECESGWECPNTDGTGRQACAAGEASAAGEETCAACTAGYFTSTIASELCLKCPVGKYSDGSFTSCLTCPAGSQCSDPTAGAVACDAGEYSYDGADACRPCPPGAECPSRDGFTLCADGTYSPGGLQSCLDCESGYICRLGSVTATPSHQIATPSMGTSSGLCPKGGYCDPPSTFISCSAGTYNPLIGGDSAASCLTCPAGYYCPSGSDEPSVCPEGQWCAAGSPSGTPCVAGTYNFLLGQFSIEACIPCEPGTYCVDGATSDDDRVCPTGHYCPSGTDTATTYPCPAGRFQSEVGAKHSEDCIMCPAGSWCAEGVDAPTECLAGTYQPNEGAGEIDACLPCPPGFACGAGEARNVIAVPELQCDPGHYCVRGSDSKTESDCPAGRYSDLPGLKGPSQCEMCPKGSICAAGSTVPGPCTAGGYCPVGSGAAVDCPKGRYSAATDNSEWNDCTVCPPGSYCEQGADAVSACGQGNYCPEGTSREDEFPCPAGRYSTATDLTSAGDCTVCAAPNYCPQGSTEETACPAGTYSATDGTQSAVPGEWPNCQPCPAGFECTEGTETPVGCEEEEYSPQQSGDCSACLAGYYCDNAETSEETMLLQTCPAGMFCDTGTGAPTTPCSAGNYCPEGTDAEVGCPAGTYNPFTGRASVDDCLACPAGDYCEGGDSDVTGSCAVGYYCPEGSTATNEVACPPGTYRDGAGGTSVESCSTCPTRKYCPEGTHTPEDCPAGHYCPEGSAVAEPCPLGSYDAGGLLMSVDECTKCDPGSYCDTLGATATAGLCDPGYYCIEGAFVSAPTELPWGGICPEGGYCEEGSSEAASCPAGTYNNFEGASSEDDCIQCSAGQYCLSSNSPEPTGDCDDGYVCAPGQTTPNDPANEAPLGTMAPAGTAVAIQCPPGTYQDVAAQSSCKECDAGFYCPDQGMSDSTTHQCPEGHYCPAGSATPVPCPVGTYLDTTQAEEDVTCKNCDGGDWCGEVGMVATGEDCHAGYICETDSQSSSPIATICPAGSYCEAGVTEAVGCPAGTYNPSEGKTHLSDCIDCPGGQYCEGEGNTEPTADCSEGYYCTSAAESATPPDDATGGECDGGYFCVEGSSHQVGCPAGTYSDDGASSCTTCEAGFYCPEETASASKPNCGAGHYCAEASKFPIPCPPGTFTSSTNIQDEDSCTPCSEGHYCPESGLTADPTTNLCDAGFFCLAGALNPQGDTRRGQLLLDGLVGWWTFDDGSDDSAKDTLGNADGSLINIDTSSAWSKGAGSMARHGGLVLDGEDDYVDFGVNGANLVTESTTYTVAIWFRLSDAISGIQGLVSISQGDADFGLRLAASGHPEIYNGASFLTSTLSITDTDWHHVVAVYDNDVGRVLYQDGAERADDTDTFAQSTTTNSLFVGTDITTGLGFNFEGTVDEFRIYNKALTFDEQNWLYNLPSTGGACPAGSFCPEETGDASHSDRLCDAGSYSPSVNAESDAECLDCPAGQYCADEGLVEPSGYCEAGYFCPEGSTSAQESACTAGHYCPEGSLDEIECEPGTFQDGGGEAECKTCTAGFYSDEYGLTICKNCPEGHYCLEGTTKDTQYPCPEGTYRGTQNGEAVTDCDRCDQGSYCEGTGNLDVDGACTEGFYCAGAAQTDSPQLPEDTNSLCTCKESWSFDGETYSGCAYPYISPTDGSEDETGASCDEDADEPCYWCIVEGTDCGTATADSDWRDEGNGDYWDWCRPAKECPVGHYCEANSVLPTPCPDGTYAPTPGGTDDTACEACPAGSYCFIDDNGDFQQLDCDEGYICTGGSSVANCPGGGCDGIEACSLGHYCLAGAAAETECDPGTYAPDEGLGECYACPEGYYCPLDGMGDAEEPVACEPGGYCPEGSVYPTPCPVGTYSASNNLVSASQCTPCPGGQYCATTGLLAPEGTCSRGYYCKARSYSPTPTDPELTASSCNCLESWEYDGETYSGCGPDDWCYTDDTDGNCGVTTGDYGVGGTLYWDTCKPAKICPTGSFCEEGSSDPTSCPAGTYNPYEGIYDISQCVDCEPGMACTVEGLSEPDDECFQGYFCPGGQDTQTPSEFGCSVGHYCPSGSKDEKPCERGDYQDSKLQSGCNSCPAGDYCAPHGVSDPVECPEYHYCPAGSSRAPMDCPAGYFGSSTEGQTSDDLCTKCEAGEYCNVGEPKKCAAGFLCVSGSDTPIPDPDDDDDKEDVGRKCDIGHYCLAGTTEPVPCPDGLYSVKEGGSKESDCRACQPGFKCEDNESFLCPIGEFCPGGGEAVQQCPSGTFSDVEGAESISTCRACREGFFCKETGLSDFGEEHCPQAHYCPEGTSAALPCPAGSFRDSVGATGSDDCYTCPGAYYCPQQVDEPIPCPAGTYCTEGFGEPLACPPGSFCPDPVEREMVLESAYCAEPDSSSCPCPTDGGPCPCPEGWYCPAGVSDPIRCEDGKYCPAEHAVSLWCPLGTMTNADAEVRSSEESACLDCPEGTYGADASRQECTPCEAGYVCMGRTSTQRPSSRVEHNGYACPVGHYCPEGTTPDTIRPCPPGTYNEREGASSEDECIPCPAGSSNDQFGQERCTLCGSSASSEEGGTTCFCIGSNRVFQKSTKKCLCQPGFQYFDESGFRMNAEDSQFDCQPIIYSACGQGFSRSVLGVCEPHDVGVTDGETGDLVIQSTQCDEGLTFDPTLGMCVVPEEEAVDVCDESCREAQNFLVVSDSGDLLYCFPSGTIDNGGCASANTTVSVQGNYNCDTPDSSGGCNAFVVQFDASGPRGVYDPTEAVLGGLSATARRRMMMPSFVRVDDYDYDYGGKISAEQTVYGKEDDIERQIRQLQLQTSTLLVERPSICLIQGETLVFYVERDEDTGQMSYPVYVKDSLLNTNPSFDYGWFEEVQTQVELDQDPSPLAYTFEDIGTYTFADSVVGSLMVVTVLPDDDECGDARITPATSDGLARLGVRRSEEILIKPDWVAYGPIIAGLCLLFAGIIYLVYLLRQKKWFDLDAKPPYARVGKDTLGLYGNVEGNKTKFAGSGVALDDEVDLENFNVKLMEEKLHDKSVHVKMQMQTHEERLKSFYNKVTNQTKELKDMVSKANDEPQQSESLARKTKMDVSRRKHLASRISSKLELTEKLVEANIDQRNGYNVKKQLATDDARSKQQELLEHLRAVDHDKVRLDLALVNERTNAAHNFISDACDSHRQESERRGLKTEDDYGAVLLDHSGRELGISDLTDESGDLKPIPGLVVVDPKTKLLVPSADAQILQANGNQVRCPSECCIHPSSGRVIPIAGNCGVNPLTGEIRVVQNTMLKSGTAEPFGDADSEPPNLVATLLMYVPSFGPVPQPLQDIKLAGYGEEVSDPISHLDVTLTHASTTPDGKLYPLLGATVDLMSGMSVPITLGETMVDSISGSEVSITGVGVAPRALEPAVVPVGGCMSLGNGAEAPISIGSTFLDPVSGKEAVIKGSCLDERGEASPFSVGHDTWTDAAELQVDYYHHKAINDMGALLSQYANQLEGATSPEDAAAVKKDMEPKVQAAEEKIEKWKKMVKVANDTKKMLELKVRSHNIRKRKSNEDVKRHGGVEGVLDAGDGTLEIIKGGMMKDPNGSGELVPIVDVVQGADGNKVPLGGTYVDPDGNKAPIKLGAKMLDEKGNVRVIAGVSVVDGKVVPVYSANSGAGDAESRVREAQQVAEAESAARGSYDRRLQRIKEDINDSLQAYKAATEAAFETHSPDSSEEASDVLLTLRNDLAEAQRVMDDEVARRKGNASAADAMGSDVYAEMTAVEVKEIEAQSAYLNSLSVLVTDCQPISDELDKINQKLDQIAKAGEGGDAPTLVGRCKELEEKWHEIISMREREVKEKTAMWDAVRDEAKYHRNEARALLAERLAKSIPDKDLQQLREKEDGAIQVAGSGEGTSGGSSSMYYIDPKLIDLVRGLLSLPGGANVDHLKFLIGGELPFHLTQEFLDQIAVEETKPAGQAKGAPKDEVKSKKETTVRGKADLALGAATAVDEEGVDDVHELARDIRLRHYQDSKDIEENMEKEMAKELEELHRRLEKKKEAMLREQKAKLEERINNEEDDGVRERLLNELNNSIERLDQVMEAEKSKQEEDLLARLRAKKERKRIALQKKHDIEAKALEVASQQAKEREDLKQQHVEEVMKYEADLKAKEEEEFASEKQSLEKEAEQRVAKEKMELERKMSAVEKDNSLSDTEKKRILAEHERNLKNIDHAMHRELEDQESQLREKLMLKRRKKKQEKQKKLEEELERKAKEQARELEEQNKKIKEEVAQLDKAEENDADIEVDVTDAVQEQHMLIEKETEEHKRRIRDEQREEKKRLEEQIKEEERKEAEALAKAVEEERQRKKEEAKRRMEEELARSSAKEKARVIDEYNRTIAGLESAIDAEKQQQEDELKAKLEAKKQRRKRELVKKQQEKLVQESAEQERKKREAEIKIAKEAETRILQEALEVDINIDIGTQISKVMKKRHERDTINIVAEHNVQRAALLQAALDDLDNQQEAEMTALVGKQTAELQKMKDLNVPQKDLVNLEASHARTKAELSNSHASVQFEVKNEVLADIDVRFAEEKLELKLTQLQEIQDAWQQLKPDDAEAQKAGEEAQKAFQELRDFRRQMDEERKAAKESVREEKEKFEEEQRQKMEEELAKFEKELEANRKEEETQALSQMEELARRKAMLVLEKKAKEEEESRALGNLTTQQRDKIMAEHAAERDNLLARIDIERDRQKEKLRSQLEHRKEEKKREQILRTQEEFKRKMDSKRREEKRRLARLNQNLASEFSHVVVRTLGVYRARDVFMKRISKEPTGPTPQDLGLDGVDAVNAFNLPHPVDSVLPSTPVKPRATFGEVVQHASQSAASGEITLAVPDVPKKDKTADLPRRSSSTIVAMKELDEKVLTDLLVQSPLFERLQNVESLLQKSVSSGQEATTDKDGQKVHFMDMRDKAWENEGKLETVDPDHLSAKQCLCYKFCLYVTELVGMAVSIHVAKSLPANNFSKNAFRRSFYYDSKVRAVYLRQQRLENVGECILCLIHILAHQRIDDFTDDTTAAFLDEFYGMLRTVSQEYAVTRVKLKVSNQSDTPLHEQDIPDLFGNSMSLEEKTDFLASAS